MSESIATAVRRDLYELIHDLASHLTVVHGGTLAHNQEVVAEYLIEVMGVPEDDTLTEQMLRDVQIYARKGVES